ncbi:MAG TPA: hypothetical protein VHB54_19650 [Mucilaginibacter sp.]|nr:hypothetical protein [Mucilaginibacter sp.]
MAIFIILKIVFRQNARHEQHPGIDASLTQHDKERKPAPVIAADTGRE